MVLQNGSFHVVETVDATGDESSFRKTITEIAMSALILERARMKFGEPQIQNWFTLRLVSLRKLHVRPLTQQSIKELNW
jgi:hypothetical protein